MSTIGWVIVLVLGVPLILLMAWTVLQASLVRVPPGRLGLVLSRGRPTDTILTPGVHLVPALRRRAVVEYPGTELVLRFATTGEPDSDFDRLLAPLPVVLGDRATAEIECTVRFRLDLERLRLVHERFGPDGVWAMVRDSTARAVQAGLGLPTTGVDDLFTDKRPVCESRLTDLLAEALSAAGIELVGFSLGRTELGRTGDVIQATVRARFELELERVGARTRELQMINDTDFEKIGNHERAGGASLYRHDELLREAIAHADHLHLAATPSASISDRRRRAAPTPGDDTNG